MVDPPGHLRTKKWHALQARARSAWTDSIAVRRNFDDRPPRVGGSQLGRQTLHLESSSGVVAARSSREGRHFTLHSAVPIPISMERLLSVSEIAALLGVSRAQVYRYVDAGLPFVRLSGRVLRFRPSDVQRWVDGLVTSASESPDASTRHSES